MASIRAAMTALAATAFATLLPALARAQSDAGTDAATQDAGDAATGDASLPPTPTACPAGSAGCVYAPIAFDHRVGLPGEFDYDTGWQPAGSPLQIRFHAAMAGHTEVRAAGWLEGSWPTAMELRTPPAAGTGVLTSDWGVELMVEVRFHVEVEGTTYDWTGNVPYIPRVDFRATASQSFDPWAWTNVGAEGSTMRQLLASVPLTNSLIPIPGISGGVSFSAQVDLATTYHSTDITFGGAADPISAMTDHVQGYFGDGASVDYYPRLEGHVDWSSNIHIWPSLYIAILGHHFTVDLFELPVDLGPFGQDWQFDPSHAVLQLPDVAARNIVVDFGDVPLGTTARDGAPFESDGEVPVIVTPPSDPAPPFSWPPTSASVPPHTTVPVPVDFTPTRLGPIEQHVVFHTNDPDTATLEVTLRGNGIPGAADAGHADAAVHDAGDGGIEGSAHGGCGCRTTPARDGATGGLAVGVMLLAMARRRRRVVS